MPKHKPAADGNLYKALLKHIFLARYGKGDREVSFSRDDIVRAAKALHRQLPKNLGDVVYSMRYRIALPPEIVATQPAGEEWIIEGTGRAQYAFRLTTQSRIAPNPALITIKIPDATPEIVAAFTQSDEQALLAKVRYNRLVDLFLGITAYSLQNHLRTSVGDIGQIEIDELYVGIDRHGCQYVVPVQAKGGRDQLSPVQMKQDLACCLERFPSLQCRAVAAQFITEDLIALFELRQEDGTIKVVDEKHYRLVPSEEIDVGDLRNYATSARS